MASRWTNDWMRACRKICVAPTITIDRSGLQPRFVGAYPLPSHRMDGATSARAPARTNLGSAQRTTLPGVVGWENERAALISRGPLGMRVCAFQTARAESRDGRSAARPGAGTMSPQAARPGGRRAERRPRPSLRACARYSSAEASRRAKSETQWSVGAVSCRVGNRVSGRLGARPYFDQRSPCVVTRLTAAPWVKRRHLRTIKPYRFR
jgi:hypothetical protein